MKTLELYLPSRKDAEVMLELSYDIGADRQIYTRAFNIHVYADHDWFDVTDSFQDKVGTNGRQYVRWLNLAEQKAFEILSEPHEPNFDDAG